ncbi:DUF429 domain-containing protein [Paraburkholderia sediminicola]|uniref:DUF429 domain-containing protein n=1 Tax=Paraburkholderia sediminicola TaxID=458836 RepID=UPI0038BD2A6C
MRSQRAVAGIDIGGDRKGNHLVILRDTQIVCNLRSQAPEQMVEKCLQFEVGAVGNDAPCLWRVGEAGRQAEKELAQRRIFSFATPTRATAMTSKSGFYGWMFNGELVYQAFAPYFPLFKNGGELGERVCFETFPHAIASAFLGTAVASAKQKRTQRREILQDAGIDAASLKSIDEVDAALCALTAHCLLDERFVAYGDELGGFIVVPTPTGTPKGFSKCRFRG